MLFIFGLPANTTAALYTSYKPHNQSTTQDPQGIARTKIPRGGE